MMVLIVFVSYRIGQQRRQGTRLGDVEPTTSENVSTLSAPQQMNTRASKSPVLNGQTPVMDEPDRTGKEDVKEERSKLSEKTFSQGQRHSEDYRRGRRGGRRAGSKSSQGKDSWLLGVMFSHFQ